MRRLRRDFPIDRPVKLRFKEKIKDTDGSNLFGYVDTYDIYYVIYIAKYLDRMRLPQSVVVDTLFHEYAHCMAGGNNHSWRRYFREYAKIYQLYIDELKR